MSDRKRAMQLQVEETRARAAASVEALSYRTDVRARAKDAVESGKERLMDRIADQIVAMKDTVGKAASTVQAGVDDLAESARPHVAAAVETFGDVAADVGAHIADDAHQAQIIVSNGPPPEDPLRAP